VQLNTGNCATQVFSASADLGTGGSAGHDAR
jgi:hypothetical protein